MEVGDLPVINRLTSLADANRLLNDVKARERSIEMLLEKLQINRAAKERELSVLQASTSEVGHLYSCKLKLPLLASSESSYCLYFKYLDSHVFQTPCFFIHTPSQVSASKSL